MKTIPHSSRAQGKSCAQLIDLAWSERSREEIVEMLNTALKGIFASTSEKSRDIILVVTNNPDSTDTTIMEYFVDECLSNRIPMDYIDELQLCDLEVDQLTKQKYPPRSFSNRGKGKRKQW